MKRTDTKRILVSLDIAHDVIVMTYEREHGGLEEVKLSMKEKYSGSGYTVTKETCFARIPLEPKTEQLGWRGMNQEQAFTEMATYLKKEVLGITEIYEDSVFFFLRKLWLDCGKEEE